MTFRSIIWAAVSTPEQATDQKESIPAQIEQARKVEGGLCRQLFLAGWGSGLRGNRLLKRA